MAVEVSCAMFRLLIPALVVATGATPAKELGRDILSHFTYNTSHNQIIYWSASTSTSVHSTLVHKWLDGHQTAYVGPTIGTLATQEQDPDACILDPLHGGTVADVTASTFGEVVKDILAARLALRRPSESLLVLALGDFNVTLAMAAKCMTAFPRSLTTWVLKSDVPSPPGAPFVGTVHNLLERLPQKLQLQDQVYMIDSYLMIYEVYAIKGQPFVRPLFPLNSTLATEGPVVAGSLIRRKDFEGLPIQVAHVKQDSVYTRSGQETRTLANVHGSDYLTYDFFAYMQDFLHFEAQFHNTDTWVTWGAPGEVSMSDLLNEDTVDLSLSSIGMWANINFSFLLPTREHREVYVYYHSADETATGNLFREIFDLNALLCVVALVVTVFFLCRFFFQGAHVEELFMWCGSVFSQQGIEPEAQPRTKHEIASRVYFLAVTFGCLMFYTILSGFLLAKFSTETGIMGVTDLAVRGYKFGTAAAGLVDNGFIYGYYTPATPLWPIRKIYSPYKEEWDGILEAVNKPRTAYVSMQNSFISFSEELHTAVTSPNCPKLRQMILVGDKRWGAPFIKPESEFASHFNYARLRAMESGITRRTLVVMQRMEAETKPTCLVSGQVGTSTEDSSNRGLYLQEIVIVFYILGLGVGASLALLFVELWRYKCRPNLGKNEAWALGNGNLRDLVV